MMYKKITIILILIVAAVLIGWDLVVATNETPGDTISAIIYETAKSFLAIPLAFGAIMGHFFCPIQTERTWKEIWIPMITIEISCLIWDLFRQLELSNIWITLAFVVGIVMGHYLWPNRGKEGA